MTLTVVPADPAGNRTLLVLDWVEPALRPSLAAWMLERGIGRGEQAGFVAPPQRGGWGRLEMMGGEFCGNATRAFGLWLARQKGIAAGTVPVEISGCDRPLQVEVDAASGEASAQMPLPRRIETVPVPGLGPLPALVLEGITHLPVVGEAADEKTIRRIVQSVQQQIPSDAVGVLFFRPETQEMVPAVYVEKTATTVFESSCGSGSVALAIWLGEQLGDGEHRFAFRQPGGVIEAAILREHGKTVFAAIGGAVSFDPPLLVDCPSFAEGQ